MNGLKKIAEKYVSVPTFPSPAGVNYYESMKCLETVRDLRIEFPFPAGVNYYESIRFSFLFVFSLNCFRPQQGLTIMNDDNIVRSRKMKATSFRPQQGLTIMNLHLFHCRRTCPSFRPQQGLIPSFFKLVSVPSRG